MNASVPTYIIGHLDWSSRLRFAAGIGAALILMITVGYSIVRPWDPQGAISLLLVNHPWYLVLRLTGLLLAIAVLATIVFDARLTQFGTFAAMIGLAWPVLRTGGMDYLMVRMQEGREYDDPGTLWLVLVGEMLIWLVPLLAVYLGSAITHRWIRPNDVRSILAAPANPKQPHPPLWRGLAGTATTIVSAVLLISLLCASREKGQVVFAVAASFFIGALVADSITVNERPFWQIIAVPIVAIAVYLYTWTNPDRPGGSEMMLHLAPNRPAGILPIEYLAAGVPAAIFGTWTSLRARYSKHHE